MTREGWRVCCATPLAHRVIQAFTHTISDEAFVWCLPKRKYVEHRATRHISRGSRERKKLLSCTFVCVFSGEKKNDVYGNERITRLGEKSEACKHVAKGTPRLQFESVTNCRVSVGNKNPHKMSLTNYYRLPHVISEEGKKKTKKFFHFVELSSLATSIFSFTFSWFSSACGSSDNRKKRTSRWKTLRLYYVCTTGKVTLRWENTLFVPLGHYVVGRASERELFFLLPLPKT